MDIGLLPKSIKLNLCPFKRQRKSILSLKVIISCASLNFSVDKRVEKGQWVHLLKTQNLMYCYFPQRHSFYQRLEVSTCIFSYNCQSQSLGWNTDHWESEDFHAAWSEKTCPTMTSSLLSIEAFHSMRGVMFTLSKQSEPPSKFVTVNRCLHVLSLIGLVSPWSWSTIACVSAQESALEHSGVGGLCIEVLTHTAIIFETHLPGITPQLAFIFPSKNVLCADALRHDSWVMTIRGRVQSFIGPWAQSSQTKHGPTSLQQ